ncbi:hypothetical protein L208DRAFT_1416257 [Tricholoma matsutake]|nr:hypothetical protein L208DRAFT_1416257 [Tricholoma matsutake 945]
MFNAMIQQAPVFEDPLSEFVNNPSLLDMFISNISSTGSAAHQGDMSSIRYNALAYILRNNNDTLNPPITKEHAKCSCGFSHPFTACLYVQ